MKTLIYLLISSTQFIFSQLDDADMKYFNPPTPNSEKTDSDCPPDNSNVGEANSCSTACNPCEQSAGCLNFCCENLKFAVWCDYLYWGVCRTDISYLNENEVEIYHSPDYKSGFRIGGSITACPWVLDFRYLSYDAKSNKSTPDVMGSVPQGPVSYKLDYSLFDFSAGTNIPFECACAVFTPFVGVKWTDIKEIRDQFLIGESEFSYDICGTGLTLGSNMRWVLCSSECCGQNIVYALVTRYTTSWMKMEFKFSEDEGENADDRNKECVCSTLFEGYVGLDITFCGCLCFDPFLQIGYETHQWTNWREWSSNDDLASLSIDGLVVRFGGMF